MKRIIIFIILIFFTFTLYAESPDILYIKERLESISKGHFPPGYIEFIRNYFVNNPDSYSTKSLIDFLKDRELKENADILALQIILAVLSDNISKDRLTGIFNDLNRKDLISILGKDYDSMHNAVHGLYIQIEYIYYTNRYYRFYQASQQYMRNRLLSLQKITVPNPFDNSLLLIADIDEGRVKQMHDLKRMEAGKIEAYTHRMLYDFSFYWEGLYSLYISYHALNQTISNFDEVFSVIDAFFEDTLDEAYLFSPHEYITGNIKKKALSFEAMLQKRIDGYTHNVSRLISEIDSKTREFNNKVRLYNESNNRNFAQARIISSPDPVNFDLKYLYDTHIKGEDSVFDHACFNEILKKYKSLSELLDMPSPLLPDTDIFSGLPPVSDLPVLQYIINECKEAGVPMPPFQRTRNISDSFNSYSKGTIQRMVFDYFNHEIANYRNWIETIENINTFEISMRNTLDHLFVHPSLYNRDISGISSADKGRIDYAYRNLFGPEPEQIDKAGYNLPDNILSHVTNAGIDPERFLYYLKRSDDSLSSAFNKYIKNTVSNHIKGHLTNKGRINLLSERLKLLSDSFYLGSLIEPIYYTDNTFFYSNNEKVFRDGITFRKIGRALYLDNNNHFFIDLNELPDIYIKDTEIKSIYDYLR